MKEKKNVMQEDLLTEYSIPNLNLKRFHEILSQNSVRLVNLLKEHDKFVTKKGNFFSASEFYKCYNSKNCTKKMEKITARNQNFIYASEAAKKFNNKNNCVPESCNAKKKQNELKRKHSKSTCEIASDLGWGSENENEEEELEKTRSYPSRPFLKQENISPWEIDFSSYQSYVDINQLREIEPQDNVSCYGMLYRESDEFSSPQPENHVPYVNLEDKYDPLPSSVSKKFTRCYYPKKLKHTTNTFDAQSSLTSEDKNSPVCIISEVVGNANDAFNNSSFEKVTLECPIITLKKTHDITKIKGWRRKQFLVEKPTTVEFYSYDKRSEKKKINLEDIEKLEDPGNIENAFVCDNLDEFLDREAELKVDYEVPHLFAEVGIKLTSEDIVSKPNVSQEDFKKVESKYCIKLPPPPEVVVLNETEYRGREKRIKTEECVESYKILKLDKNKRRFIEVENKTEDLKKFETEPSSVLKSVKPPMQMKHEDSRGNRRVEIKPEISPNKMSLITKLIGVVVYPNSFKPVHPLVRRHLHKLRSYYTKIDSNWANFAASALGAKWQSQQINRKILPVYCTGKLEKKISEKEIESEVKKAVEFLVNSVSENSMLQPSNSCLRKSEVIITVQNYSSPNNIASKQKLNSNIKLKECSVPVEKLNFPQNYKIWCMDHNRFNCSLCGFYRYISKSSKSSNVKNIIGIKEIPRFLNQGATSPSLFSSRLTNLLTKKLRSVAFKDSIVDSIDKLKILVPNGLELIKLNFVKQSFLTGYINIWYLKAKTNLARSRAFLTFSKAPPIPKAINIKRAEKCLEGFPKVISEIVSSDNVFDDDEYAILHCNGKSWEIHGSLNVAIEKDQVEEKCEEGVEQIFIPLPPIEMENIRKISMQLLKVKAAKWWVLDLSQNFTEMILDISCRRTVITRKHLFAVIKSKFLGFLAVKRRKGRLYGTVILDTLFPFILVGPFYTFEKCTLFVRSKNSKVPFDYKVIDNLPQNQSLKYFINSVIMGMEGNGKKLEGLWLYDKSNMDDACYLQTFTPHTHGLFPKTDYCLETEHGYGLNSLTSNNLLRSTRIISKSKNGKVELQVPVYLYFEVFDLGYITGQLQVDNSVVISHPLSPGTRVKSHKIGDLFVRMLRRRMKFIPENYSPKWFVTKYKDDLRERQPFDKFFLDGIYILCKKGICSMLKINNLKIRELGLKKEEVLRAISENEIICEVIEFRKLKILLCGNSHKKSREMEYTLKKAIRVIRKLEKASKALLNTKRRLEKQQLKRLENYSSLLDCSEISTDIRFRSLRFVNVQAEKKLIVPSNQTDVNKNFKLLLKELETKKSFSKAVKLKIMFLKPIRVKSVPH